MVGMMYGIMYGSWYDVWYNIMYGIMCIYIPYCLELWPGCLFLFSVFNPATKQDRRLLVEDSHTVYNL